MKLTIKGSTFKSYNGPLGITVRELEGTDYDSIRLAIREIGGRMYLNSRVDQPWYNMYGHICLSEPEEEDGEAGETGKSGESGQNATSGESGEAGTADSGIEPCGKENSFVMKVSDLANLNRNVGAQTAIYEFMENERLYAKLDNDTRLCKSCKPQYGIFSVPRHVTADDSREGLTNVECLEPYGAVMAEELSEKLKWAINVARRSSGKGQLKSSAIHFSFDADKMTLEAMSTKGALSQEVKNYPAGGYEEQLSSETLHFAISLPAAVKLKEICDFSGGAIYWSRDSEKPYLFFSSSDFTECIITEQVSGCHFPALTQPGYEVIMDRKQLLEAVYHASVCGNDVTSLEHTDDARNIKVTSGIRDSETVVDVCWHGESDSYFYMDLSTATLSDCLRAIQGEQVHLSYNDADDFVMLQCPDDTTRCALSMLY